MALIYNATFDSQTRVLSLLDKAGNVISSCEVPSKSGGNELTLTATADNSSVKLIKNGRVENNTYEVNTGSGWGSYTFGTYIHLNKGQSCKWRCSAHPSQQYVEQYVQFVMTGTIEASGNCNSMLSSDFDNITSLTGYQFAFTSLFKGCAALTRAPELPATTLADSCYYKMFYECVNLVQAPELPALSIPDSFLYDRTIVSGCYASMFEGCTSLVQAPALPATTLGKGCYVRMFYGCMSLVKAPELPATTLPDVLNEGGTSEPAFGCYSDMFGGCYNLVQAPSLPATTLGGACYGYMFYGCRSLVKAPELPATTLTFYCYAGMFQGCRSLNEIRVSATDISAGRCTNSWIKDVSSTGDFYCNPDTAWTTEWSGIPSGWTRRNINLINALTLTATADNSSVKLTKKGTLDNTFEVDTGNGWTAYEFDTVIPLNAGQSCKWRCSAHPTTQSGSNYVKFVMTGTIEASGNVNSMLLGGFENLTSLFGYEYAFYQLFSGCSSLTKAPNLPATTLASKCYSTMFNGCTALTQAPNLPATTLSKYCYSTMFSGCSALTQAPNLPATTLADYCYEFMFSGCSALTQAPNLPATTLSKYCYDAMFYDCSALTQAPNLPATKLAVACYGSMFHGCSSLTKAPNLPATTLAGSCYRNMFENCSALAEVRIAATTTASSALKYWLLNVASSGTVYAVPTFNDLPTNSESGVPSGWTRRNIADYPNP